MLQMPEGLSNLFGQEKPGGRVAAFGPKLGSRLAFLVDPLVKAAVRALRDHLRGAGLALGTTSSGS